MARQIAAQFRLAATTVVATFTSNLPVPARVESANDSEFFIEIDAAHRLEPDCIAAILAHEIAHVFLHRRRIALEPEFRNEVLTDTTATYFGCGVLIMNAAWRGKTGSTLLGIFASMSSDMCWQSEICVLDGNRGDMVSSAASLEDVCSSRRGDRLRSEYNERPFVPAGRRERLTHWLWHKLISENGFRGSCGTVFSCRCCTQSLRVPSTNSVLSVRCPTCDSRFRCYP